MKQELQFQQFIGALLFVLTVSSCVSLHMLSILQEGEVLGAGWEVTSEGVEETTTCPDRGEGDSEITGFIIIVAIDRDIVKNYNKRENISLKC